MNGTSGTSWNTRLCSAVSPASSRLRGIWNAGTPFFYFLEKVVKREKGLRKSWGDKVKARSGVPKTLEAPQLLGCSGTLRLFQRVPACSARKTLCSPLSGGKND